MKFTDIFSSINPDINVFESLSKYGVCISSKASNDHKYICIIGIDKHTQFGTPDGYDLFYLCRLTLQDMMIIYRKLYNGNTPEKDWNKLNSNCFNYGELLYRILESTKLDRLEIAYNIFDIKTMIDYKSKLKTIDGILDIFGR